MLDAAGGLVTESFVDAHKVYTLDRVGDAALAAYTKPGMGAAMTAIEIAPRVKAVYDESWIYENAGARFSMASRTAHTTLSLDS